MFTKQHFEAIARYLRPYIDSTYLQTPKEREVATKIAIDLASYFETQNPRFDKDKFLTACNVIK